MYFQNIKQGASVISGLVLDNTITLSNKENVNVLLLGIGGGNHDGPELSDTIILANIKPKLNKINLLSIPRDLWVPAMQAKINIAYPTGQVKGSGISYSKSEVEKVTGQHVDYALVVDFSAFEEIIDLLGGIDVDVQRSFDDYFYPISEKEKDLCGYKEEEKEFTEEEAKGLQIKPGKVKVLLDKDSKIATAAAEPGHNIVYTDVQVNTFFACRFEHLSFKKGITHMDGVTALKFARSRHGLGGEGTDFARSQRQHLIINSIKNKTLSLGTILNPVKVLGIYNVIKENINTDISTEEIDDFIKLAQKMEDPQVNNYVIDEGNLQDERYGLLTTPLLLDEYNGQWVLIPRAGNGNFSEISRYVKCITEDKVCDIKKDSIVQAERN